MLQLTQIYQDIDTLKSFLKDKNFDLEQRCLVRFFTSNFIKIDILETIHNIRNLLPNCQLVGSTSSTAVIYDSEIYENSSVVIINTFEKLNFDTKFISWIDKTPAGILKELKSLDGDFVNVIFSNTSRYLDDIIDDIINLSNLDETPIKLAGGFAGIVDGKSLVFNHRGVEENGLIAFSFSEKVENEDRISFDDLEIDSIFSKYDIEDNENENNSNLFSKATLSIEPISGNHKVTKVNNGNIVAIDDIPVADWFYSYLDVNLDENLTLEEFKEVFNDEYLWFFSIILPSNNNMCRFPRFDKENEELSLYCTEMSVGDKIKVGYLCAKKMIRDSYKICSELISQNIESLFVYSCINRKMVLDNIVELELLPFKDNDVSGIFAIGEIGNINNINTFNTLTLSVAAFGENENFLNVNTKHLKGHEFTKEELKFYDKALRKQSLYETKVSLKNDVSNNNVQLQDPNFELPNVNKFEIDVKEIKFNKLAVIEIMTADATIAAIGHEAYISSCKEIFSVINKTIGTSEIFESIGIYVLNHKTFIMACRPDINDEKFLEFMRNLFEKFQIATSKTNKISNVARFAVVFNRKDLLRVATAMLYNNINSQDSFFVYDGKDDVNNDYIVNEEFYIEMIKHAIETHSVIPHYQGIRDNTTNEIDKYEALMRIEYQNEIYYPNTFLPIAKKYKLYNMLSEIMIKKALTEFEKRNESISINLSIYDIESSYFREWLLERLRLYPYPERVIIEFVETEDCNNLELMQQFIDDVHAIGSKIAIDDFGSGYSTFTTIMNLKPDFIKIDGSIVSKIDKSEGNLKILDTICYLAESMGIKTIAEFVDNAEVQALLVKNNVDHSQGYYFSKPSLMEVDELTIDQVENVEETN